MLSGVQNGGRLRRIERTSNTNWVPYTLFQENVANRKKCCSAVTAVQGPASGHTCSSESRMTLSLTPSGSVFKGWFWTPAMKVMIKANRLT